MSLLCISQKGTKAGVFNLLPFVFQVPPLCISLWVPLPPEMAAACRNGWLALQLSLQQGKGFSSYCCLLLSSTFTLLPALLYPHKQKMWIKARKGAGISAEPLPPITALDASASHPEMMMMASCQVYCVNTGLFIHYVIMCGSKVILCHIRAFTECVTWTKFCLISRTRR